MIPHLYEKNTRDFSGTGLGALPEWIKGTTKVYEGRNGEFYFEGETPADALHVDQLDFDRIITAAPAPGKPVQPFQIQYYGKPDDRDTIKVIATHVSYRLTQNYLRPARVEISGPVEGTIGPMIWLKAIPSLLWPGGRYFSFTSDINTPVTRVFDTLTKPRFVTIREALYGMEGSIVDLVGGELEWDKWTVRLLQHRGRVTGKTIRPGQNISSMSFDMDARSIVTAYLGYCNTENGRVESSLVYTVDAGDYGYPRVKPLDLTQHFRDLAGEGEEVNPTVAEVQAATEEYAAAHPAFLRKSIKYDVVPEDLQSLMLCDYVDAVYPKYGFQQTVQLVETVFDPIEEVYTELTFGEPQEDISDTLAKITQIITGAASSLFRKRGI